MENTNGVTSRSNGNGTAPPPPHVVLLATPGMGHLIPVAELAKRLAQRHGVTSTLITFASTASPTQRAFLASLPPAVASMALSPVDTSDLPRDASIETLMSEECARAVPALTEALLDLKRRLATGTAGRRRLVAFVTDIFGADAFDAARAAGVERRYLFFPTNLHALTLLLHLPDLDATVPGEFRDLAEPLRLPGCVPLPGTELLTPLQDRSCPSYRWMVHHGAKYREATAILVNTFDAVEPGPAEVLLRQPPEPGSRPPEPGSRPPVRAIGPLVRAAGNDDDDVLCPCVEWLDAQPAKSVVFVSFGSGGTLPVDEMRELALALELSGQRFLWVVRSPTEGAGVGNDNYYDSDSKKDPFAYLPPGFVERTKDAGVGLVVPSWAPQAKVLAHRATGGFLTHCGWNSTLESLVHGVPMLAWPLFADQRQNAVLLCEGVGAAIRVPATKRREDIAAAVLELMVGHGKGAAVRAKVEQLQRAAAEGLSDGGGAAAALAEVANEWTSGDNC